MKTERRLITLFSVILAACIIFTIFWMNKGGKTASIYIGGVLYKQIDLSAVTKSYEIHLEHNTLLVENGRISMLQADCPDKLCIKRGVMTGGAPIICAPRGITVVITDEEADAVSW